MEQYICSMLKTYPSENHPKATKIYYVNITQSEMSSIPSSKSERGSPSEGMFTKDPAVSATPIIPLFAGSFSPVCGRGEQNLPPSHNLRRF